MLLLDLRAEGFVWLPGSSDGLLWLEIGPEAIRAESRKCLGMSFMPSAHSIALATDTFWEWQLLLSLTSIFHALALSRTLSNSLETSLTTVALFYWPLPATSWVSRAIVSEFD